MPISLRWSCIGLGWVCWKQRRHFVELRPQPSGHLDVHLGEAKLCLPPELRRTFQRSMAFAANAQRPPCRRVSRPTLCLGTMRWRRSPELFDIVASLNLHEQILGLHASCFLQKTRLGPPTSSTFSISLASFTGVWNSRASLLFSVPRKIYFIETPASKPRI